MALAAHASWPPVAGRPGLARCEPERSDLDSVVRAWFAAWVIRHGISVRDLKDILHLSSIATAHKKHCGAVAITTVDIMCFPKRYRLDLIEEFGSLCRDNDNAFAHR